MNKLEEIFKKIKPEKRDRIINSALEEFSLNTFDKASTNNIVKNAGISKGTLFHYFKTKKNLYEYLEIFAIETMVNAILDEINWEEADLFARIKELVLIKLKVCVKYPSLVAFSKVMYEGKSRDEIKRLVESYAPEIYHQVYYRNIDFTLFRENVDVQRVIKMTQWTLEKLGEEFLVNSVSLDELTHFEEQIKEIDEYLIMLKEAFYK